MHWTGFLGVFRFRSILMRRFLTSLAFLILPLAAQDLSSPNVLLPPEGSLPEPKINPSGGFFEKQEDTPFSSMPTSIQFGPKTDFKLDNITGKPVLTLLPPISITGNNGVQAFANHGVYDFDKQTVELSGDISIYQEGLVYRGDSTTYDQKTKEFDTRGLRAGMGPILLEAGQFRSVQTPNGIAYVGEDSAITTHDVENPHWWLRADRTTFCPGERVIFKNLKLYAGDTPIFWLPYLSQPLDTELGYHFAPGSRSNLGVFLKNTYGVMLGGERDPVTGANETAWILSQWQADIYSRRGLGMGLSLFDTRVDDADDFGYLKLYYLNDLDPSLQRSGIPRQNVNEDRFRVELAHRLDLWESEWASYSAEINLTWLSDAFYLEDLDPSLFNTNPSPDNTFGVSRRNDRSLALLNARLRLNDFYQSDTRLPELSYDWIKQPLLESSFLYESQTSLGIYREHLADFVGEDLRTESLGLAPSDPRLSEINRLLDPRGFNRFYTYHELARPMKAGFLNITPKIGGGFTQYSSVKGPYNSQSRSHLYAGVDTSLKFTKAYPEWISKKWGLDGAVHIIEPYTSLSFVSTNELDPSFYGIDRLTASTRPRSLNIGRFNAIDDISNWSILRLGMRNRIMTHRDGRTHDWLTIDTYFDAFFEDPEFDRSFSNLYNEIHWSPLPWFDLELETQIPLFEDSNFTEVATAATIMPTEDLEITLRYRYLNDHPILRDSNRVELELYARLNEYWGIGTQHRWEIEDGTLELQSYNLYYDFDSWVGSVGFFHRDNSVEDDYGIILGFGLKEFPKLSLPVRIGTE